MAMDIGRTYSGLGGAACGIGSPNTEKSGMKFNENMVISSELVDRNKILLNLRNMKEGE